MIFNDVIMCVYMSVIWQAKLLEMGIGQKEQIGPLCSQNVGLKIRTRKWMYFLGGRSLEAPSQFLFIYLFETHFYMYAFLLRRTKLERWELMEAEWEKKTDTEKTSKLIENIKTLKISIIQ